MEGTVTEISSLVYIKRSTIPDLYKKVLTVEEDDGQVSYPEIRNNNLNLLESQHIEVGVRVKIDYVFQGSSKNGKRYNNIYINDIKRV